MRGNITLTHTHTHLVRTSQACIVLARKSMINLKHPHESAMIFMIIVARPTGFKQLKTNVPSPIVRKHISSICQ